MMVPGPKPRRKEVIWSSDFAYAVGLMASDGNLSSDGRHFTFVSKDREQIRNIKKCFGITAHASRRPSGRKGDTNLYYRLQWGDVTLYDFLLTIGLTPNKSLTIGPLKIPPDFFFDFLRGHFDGDGCFYSYFDPRWRSSFMFYLSYVSASREFIDWLRENISKRLHVNGHVTNNKTMTFFQLKYAKADSLKVMGAMYREPASVFLSRKKLKIERALRIVGKSLLRN